MNPTAIFSKTGKGVQEASGKTSHLSRADRAVLKEIDGKTALADIAVKFEKIAADKFDALIQQLDKDGFIREVSSGATQAAPARTSAPPPRAAPPPKAPPAGGGGEEEEVLDFTQAVKLPPKAAGPKAPSVDLAAASRAEAERKEKEQQAFDYKARAEAEAKAKAEAEAKARAAAAEARVRAESEARAKAEAEAKARAEADTRSRAESDAKVKSAREAALRMAADAKAKTDAAAEREREANARARREAEEKTRLEAELTGKLEEERRGREEAERRARDATDQARREMEDKGKRDAEELRQRLEAEMKAKLEEERKKREEEDSKRREEDQRRRKEEDERRAKEDAERRAREEDDKKRREEDQRRRKEEDERRAKDEADRRAKEEAERRARAKEDADRRTKEEADRRAREEEDRKRRKEEDERRAKDDAERRAKDDAERRAKEDAERRAKEDAERRAKGDAERRKREETEAQARASQSASLPSIQPVAPAPPPAAAAGGDIGDSLLADLDSFTQREDEEAKAKEEAERKEKEEAARQAKAEAERRAKDDAERRAKEEADKKRREDEQRRAKEEAEQRAREEEERQKQEETERKRKAKEALAAKQAEEKKAAQKAAQKTAAGAKGAGDDDIGVSDDDLDMDDIKRDQKALAKTARKAALEQPVPAAIAAPRPKKWGKPAAIALFVLLVGGVGVLQVMPVSTAEYEKAASEAMGVPVKIASARLSVITGLEVRLEGVSIGDADKIKLVRGYPEIGSLFGAKKAFSRIELEGASLSQSQLADAVLGKVSGENFRVGRIVIKQAKLDGPLALPDLDVEATVSGDGTLKSVTLRGGDKLSVQLSPNGNDIAFEISAGSLALPFVPALTLSEFGMKGTANRQGVVSSEFDGRAFEGVISGTAKMRWGASWNVDGEVRARGVKVAVFAPALVSEGKVEGRANYSMSGAAPASLFETARVQGEFKIEKGVIGSFDLTRALQTGGAQTGGRTVFSELTGQGVYDKGTIQLRNIAITAGAMNAGASLDIAAGGGLSGRIAADVKTPTQTLRATLNLSGKVQDPVIRK